MRSKIFGLLTGAMALLASVSWALDGGSTGSGSSGDVCDKKVKHVEAKSECLSQVNNCGGTMTASTTTIIHGVPVTVSGGSSGGIYCCFTEVVSPAHDETEPGDKKIEVAGSVQGEKIQRSCDGPVYIFGFAFGGWDCEEDSRTPFGLFLILLEKTCVDVDPPTTNLVGGGGSIDIRPIPDELLNNDVLFFE
jgi:hypothetical protein